VIEDFRKLAQRSITSLTSDLQGNGLWVNLERAQPFADFWKTRVLRGRSSSIRKAERKAAALLWQASPSQLLHYLYA
jgi:hypothetical protein